MNKEDTQYYIPTVDQWGDCEWYGNCIGICETCEEPGNPYYDELLKDSDYDPNFSETVKMIILESWFGVHG